MQYPIIDAHCHVYPEKIAERAVKGIGDFYGLSMYYDGRYDTLVNEGSSIGVKHFIIFSVATTPRQVHSINAFIAETVKNSGGIMTGLGALHPDSETVEEDIDEITALGLKGVKMHPDFQKFAVDDEKCDKIYTICQQKGLPVLLHTGDSRFDFSNPDRIESVLKRYPDLIVIGAHFGGWSCWEKAALKLHKYKNFYVDCSSSLYALDEKQSTEYIRMYTADRVLFGVDFPMWSHKEEIERFNKMNLNEDEVKKIFYENACKLFGINKQALFN